MTCVCGSTNLPSLPCAFQVGRNKLVAIEKYKVDKSRGLIKDDEPKKEDPNAAAGGAKKKPKFKNYGYVKKEAE